MGSKYKLPKNQNSQVKYKYLDLYFKYITVEYIVKVTLLLSDRERDTDSTLS